MSRRRVVPVVEWQQLPERYREILVKLGYTKGTYEKVQAAERLLFEVNRSMRRRRANVVFGIGYTAGPADYLWRRR